MLKLKYKTLKKLLNNPIILNVVYITIHIHRHFCKEQFKRKQRKIENAEIPTRKRQQQQERERHIIHERTRELADYILPINKIEYPINTNSTNSSSTSS